MDRELTRYKVEIAALSEIRYACKGQATEKTTPFSGLVRVIDNQHHLLVTPTKQNILDAPMFIPSTLCWCDNRIDVMRKLRSPCVVQIAGQIMVSKMSMVLRV